MHFGSGVGIPRWLLLLDGSRDSTTHRFRLWLRTLLLTTIYPISAITRDMDVADEELAAAYKRTRERDLRIYREMEGTSREANQYLGDAPGLIPDTDGPRVTTTETWEPGNDASASQDH